MKILINFVVLNLFCISLVNAEGTGLLYQANKTGNLDAFSLTGSRRPVIPLVDSSKVCSSSPSLRPDGLLRLNSNVVNQMNFLSCQSSRFNAFARFTVDSCQASLACGQNLENSGLEIKKAKKTIDELIALDFIKNAIVSNSGDMERFHVMRKFAQDKIDPKLGSQCLGRYTTKGISQCDDPLMEKAFEERQSECEYGSACFKKDDEEYDVENFAKFKEKNDKKVGTLMRSYFVYRSEKIVKKKASEDDKRIESLKKLALTEEFKKAKQDQKISMIVATIGRDKSGYLKDPIIAFEFGRENPENSKQAPKFKEILKMMESKTVDKDFEKSFLAHRKKRAEFHLSGEKSCSQTKTVISICNQATLIAAGDVVPMQVENVEAYSSSQANKTGVDYELLKGLLGPDFKEEDLGAILNARRCVIYGIIDESGKPIYPSSKEEIASSSTGSYGSGRMNRAENEGLEVIPSSALESNSKKETASMLEEAGLRSGGLKNNGTPEIESAGVATKSDSIVSGDGASVDGVTAGVHPPQAQVANSFTDMFNGGNFDPFAQKPKAKVEDDESRAEEAQNARGVVQTPQDKMNEMLMKKLAVAEENLEKLKADAEAAELDKAKQKKIDEEAALIKDLKGQIADLKAQSGKTAERKIASVATEEPRSQAATTGHNNSAPNVISSSRSDLPAQKILPSEKFDSAASAQAQQAARSSGSSGSGAVLTSITNSDGSRTTTLGSGLVVTIIDGMSSEKAQQTISSRILELNGSPFFIEEGGMVKEIIAVVKDGKVLLDEAGNPIFEKIVKGKIGDKKFAAKAKDKKDRAPAAIVDVADLKRDQEEKLKRERAEYQRLKSITTGALKKK